MKPIVIAHGFLGFRQFLIWKQFPGVIPALQERGIPAIQPLVHPTATIATRAEQLLKQINQAFGPEERVHILAHSMGGLDARYLASPQGLGQGHRVITLTTLSTPHRGSSLADWVGPYLCPLFTLGSRLLCHVLPEGESRRLVGLIAENRWEALPQLRPSYLAEQFNPCIHDDPQVRYFSYAGRVDGRFSLGTMFRYPLYHSIARREGENDTMVSVDSAQWGEFKGILEADHGEMVGLSLIPGLSAPIDIVQFVLDHAAAVQALED